MPTDPTIDFRQIRPHHDDRKLSLEELTRQLLIAAPPAGMVRFEHKGQGADGGVESLVHFADGTCWGYQTKFFLDAFGSSELNQIKKSYNSALASYPCMSRYIVGLPRNLAGGVKTNQKSQRQNWDEWVNEAEKDAKAAGRAMTIVLWDETHYIAELSRNTALHAGARLYWFGDQLLTPHWFRSKFKVVKSDLDTRYSAPAHVDVSVQQLLECLARANSFLEIAASHRQTHIELRKAWNSLRPALNNRIAPAAFQALDQVLGAALETFDSIEFSKGGCIDLGPLTTAIEAIDTLIYSPPYLPARDNSQDPPTTNPAEEEDRRHLEHVRLIASIALQAVQHSLSGFDHSLLARNRLLVTGEAGAGKSHSLAHSVEAHLAAGGAGVMLLGQYFSAGDPRSEILSRLSLTTSFEAFLGAMQAAALATGKPALIVLDALNESHDLSIWSSNLAGLVTQIAQFDRIALIISCRTTYEPICMPANVDLVRAHHRGFEGDGGHAARQYLENHGIEWPEGRPLDPAFMSPLFLSSAVGRLKAEGKTAFPEGLEGTSDLFKFWLEGVELSLIRKGFRRITLNDGKLKRSLQNFAGQLAADRSETMLKSVAEPLLETEVAQIPAMSSYDLMLFRLLDEAVLRRDVGAPATGETVAFTFQRFADTFIAEALLRDKSDVAAFAQSLRPGGALEYLLSKSNPEFAGLLEALMTRAPEHYGVELVDVAIDVPEVAELTTSYFLSSLQWRSSSAITGRTIELLEHQAEDPSGLDVETLDLLFSVGVIPDNPLNADYLHGRLSRLSLADRDLILSTYLIESAEDGPVEVLLQWTLSERSELAGEDRTRLAAILIAWLTFSSNRIMRDRASRALTALFLRSPALMPGLIKTFAEANDPYVRERVFAAVLAASSFCTDNLEVLKRTALETWNAVFRTSPITPHAFIRYYARSIIELAESLDVLPSEIDLAKTRPPYQSSAIEVWPTTEDIEPHVETARSIVSSVVGYYNRDQERFTMAGDFGRYTMSAVTSFYAEPRGENAPQTRGALSDAFWAELEACGGEISALASEALAASRTTNEISTWTPILLNDEDVKTYPPILSSEEVAAARSRFEEADRALRAALGGIPIPYPDHRSESYPAFEQEKAQRWVATRAIALGWSEVKHATLEQKLGYWAGRSSHSVERIGKKYQWIAWHELIGNLQDHFWHEGRDRQPELLDNVLMVEDLDVDLSFTGFNGNAAPPGLPPLGLPATNVPQPDTVEDAVRWATALDDLPHVPDLVEGRSADGERWWMVRTFRRDEGYMDKLQSDGPTRTSQGAIQLVIVRADQIQALHDRQSAGRINSVDMGEQGHFHDRQFGQHRAGLAGGAADLNTAINGVQFGRVSRNFSPYRGEYDYGGLEEQPTFEIPRDWVLDGLNLRPAGPDQPWFIDATDTVAFYDPSASELATLVNAELLEPMLRERGYVAAWSYWGEKDGGLGSGRNMVRSDGPFERETYCGLWWREKGVWKGSLWRANGDTARSYTTDGQEQ